MLEGKTLRLGRGIPQFGITSIACSLAHSQFNRGASISPEEAAANGIAALYHKLTSLQENPVMLGETVNGSGTVRRLLRSKYIGC